MMNQITSLSSDMGSFDPGHANCLNRYTGTISMQITATRYL